MKMFKANSGWRLGVRESEVERVTEKFVVFPDGRKEAKYGANHNWFDTRGEAYEWLEVLYEGKIKAARMKLDEINAQARAIISREVDK